MIKPTLAAALTFSALAAQFPAQAAEPVIGLITKTETNNPDGVRKAAPARLESNAKFPVLRLGWSETGSVVMRDPLGAIRNARHPLGTPGAGGSLCVRAG